MVKATKQFERVLRFGEVLTAKHAAAEGLNHAMVEFNEHTQIVDKIITEAQKIVHHTIESAVNEATLQEFEKIDAKIDMIEKHHKDYEDHVHQVFALIEKGDLHAAETQAEKVEAEEEKLDHELKQFLKQIENFTHESAKTAKKDEQASTNVQMVAAASEQMSATINEIAGNAEKGRNITGDAVNQAKNVSTRVAELGKAAIDVGKVTETINYSFAPEPP